jgi:hypothetical protein
MTNKRLFVISSVGILIIGIIYLTQGKGGVEFGYAYGPLEITFDSFGEIKFKVSKGWKIPTELGTFSIGLIAEPDVHFGRENTLTICYDDQDHIYDLLGQNFDISFKHGYY